MTLLLPPGFRAQHSPRPWQHALAAAASGETPGTLLHAPIDGVLDAALILAPDQPVTGETVGRLATVAVYDALVAAAPPEMALTIMPPGTVVVNGGEVAKMQGACGPVTLGNIPDWGVLGLTVRLALRLEAPGLTPWLTDLAEEGFDVNGVALLETICRYLLSMIDLWQVEGEAGIARAWHATGAVALK